VSACQTVESQVSFLVTCPEFFSALTAQEPPIQCASIRGLSGDHGQSLPWKLRAPFGACQQDGVGPPLPPVCTSLDASRAPSPIIGRGPLHPRQASCWSFSSPRSLRFLSSTDRSPVPAAIPIGFTCRGRPRAPWARHGTARRARMRTRPEGSSVWPGRAGRPPHSTRATRAPG